MSRSTLALLVLLCLWGAWQSWTHREQAQPPGVLVPQEPLQTAFETPPAPFEHAGFHLQPRASYSIVARLLSREPYYLGDDADLAPLDFALGWGPMSDSGLLATLEVSQSGRFFHLSWQSLPLPEAEVMRHAANTHLIPANAAVARALDRMRIGQVLHLEGQLVDAERPDGWKWNTSLTRNDTGAGACELMYVESAELWRPEQGMQ